MVTVSGNIARPRLHSMQRGNKIIQDGMCRLPYQLNSTVKRKMGHIQEKPPVAILYTILTLTLTLTRGLILDNAGIYAE